MQINGIECWFVGSYFSHQIEMLNKVGGSSVGWSACLTTVYWATVPQLEVGATLKLLEKNVCYFPVLVSKSSVHYLVYKCPQCVPSTK